MEAAISTHFASIEPVAPDVFLDRLLHPARHFKHPHDVLADVALDGQEKRAILSSWASDACAVESVPALRMLPGAGEPVSFDAIMDALQQLDQSDELAGPDGSDSAMVAGFVPFIDRI
ncbi:MULTISPECIES: hypothetical protein [unclassified Mesorhizobium]|uniref:hypothetical protein n=2 Tax=Mesorhizobium TaxID=68287 RepID=UPI000FCAA665|nr:MULTISPECIES: hypothetical protein [unclassified Mesorhizobium]RVA42082.1 hypothetical protein EN933_26220 [Mesorhizobium sp. M7A.F.Ca.US.001.01.1.1]RUX69586.1 hypothetical protein EN990_34180 [Mesorhizobium sp. M7A.F.Ca.US.005.03.1.1]RUY03243.1 hypothetical protein EN991_35540 [Mesorhizobium sp. M7A.F.Ca.US.005.03.2.1]RUY98695.1 hypothetical protein EN974_14290 [Mesorhizobium sp. M7A.F.Ca.CA.001.12.2.1]RUZ18281.1 hypothetical protein EN949_27700 [Mesorhizobium sp. M7A.F.Ca.US.007.01.2.1]